MAGRQVQWRLCGEATPIALYANLKSPHQTGLLCVDQAGLELPDLPSSASQVQGVKACATASQLQIFKTVF